MSATRCLLVAVLVAVGLVPLASAPASAVPGTATFVTAVSDVNDSIGRGAERLWRDGDVTVTGDLDDGIDVRADPGGNDRYYLDLKFSAADGHQLAVGAYEDTHIPGTTEDVDTPDGGPNVDVSGHISTASANNGCDGSTGSFTVHDLASDLSRFWISYVQYCSQDAPLFGEIRYHEPVDASGLVIAPGQVAWPAAYRGQAAHPVPVTLENVGATPLVVSSASVTGSSAYKILSDDCGTIAPGGSCEVDVGYSPVSFSLTQAQLVVQEDGSQGSHVVPLTGAVIPGYTSFRMHSQEGDWIGQGGDYSYTPANARLTSSGYIYDVRLRVDAGVGVWWDAGFGVSPPDTLRAGTTYVVPQHRSDGSPGIEVDGTGRGCVTDAWGSFTVHEASYDQYHYMTSFSATFTQYCQASAGETPRGVLTGSVAWHSPTPAHALPAAPRRSTRLSLVPSARTVDDGGTTRFSGSLTWGPTSTVASSKPLVLQARPRGSRTWKVIGSARTDELGRYAISATTTRNMDYVVRYAGEQDFQPSVSSVATLLSRWRTHLGPPSRQGHRKVRLSCFVLRGHKGQVVLLQRLTPHGWVRESRKRLSALGRATFTVRPTKHGGTDRRVLVPADVTHVGTVSETQTVPHLGH